MTVYPAPLSARWRCLNCNTPGLSQLMTFEALWLRDTIMHPAAPVEPAPSGLPAYAPFSPPISLTA